MGSKIEPYYSLGAKLLDPVLGTTYIIKKLIGRGAYAQCFLAMANHEPYAIKIIKIQDLKSEKIKQKLQSEIAIHSSLDHPNIVKMFTTFKNDDFVFMVLELCERGSLDDLLKRNSKIKERYVSKFVSQIIKGLLYLHNEMSVVHRDLKLGNLFLDSQLNVKIGDFGLSAIIKNGEKRKTVCGTPNYIAPEVLFGKVSGHSFEADIWSLGVIIYTLLIGTPPFQQKKVEEIYKLIERNQYIFPSDCSLSQEAIDLISRILISNPNERPDLEEIERHKFLSQKENLAFRVYKALCTQNYRFSPLKEDHIIFSMPINIMKGIGYVLKSGICGIYYQDMTNVYFKENNLVFVKLKIENNRKIFITEEHMRNNIPECMLEHYKNIIYFIKNYTNFGNEENILNGIIKINSNEKNTFVAKVKRIKDGLLFIMTNNIFIFDFNYGSKVVIGEDGGLVYSFNDDGPIEFSQQLREECIGILRTYCNNR